MKLAINTAIYAKIALNLQIISRERYFEQIEQKRDFFSLSLPSNAFQYFKHAFKAEIQLHIFVTV